MPPMKFLKRVFLARTNFLVVIDLGGRDMIIIIIIISIVQLKKLHLKKEGNS